LERQLILAQNTGKPADSSGKSATRSSLPIVILIVVLAVAAVGVGIGLQSSSGSTQLACLSIVHDGSNLEITTVGIVYISGSTYYVACPEGTTPFTAPVSVSCLTISPQVHNFDYPDAAPYLWYYLSAPGHTIAFPGSAANSTEIIPPPDVTIQVNC
jgi:hypothetical protein